MDTDTTTRARPVREETDAERSDRRLGELLQELRVAVPGVQVIFAFLLTVPFSARFEELTAFQRDVYGVTLGATAVTTIVLLAPAAQHRMRFAQGAKGDIVRVSHALAAWGLLGLAMSIASALLLVADILFGRGAAVASAAGVLALTIALWFALPLARRRWAEAGTP